MTLPVSTAPHSALDGAVPPVWRGLITDALPFATAFSNSLCDEICILLGRCEIKLLKTSG